MTTTDKTTFVSFLLDETGSMSSIADATVDGLNTYVEGLQTGDADILFSLVSFNSNGIQRRYVAEPIRDVPPMKKEEYRPDAMTPLIDAAVKMIRATEEAVQERDDDPNVVIVVQTDGEENVSSEYTAKELAKQVKEKTEAGWEFVFLGAGLDAFAAARAAGMHLDPKQVVSYERARSDRAFAQTARNVSTFASTGMSDSLTFSPEQREELGDRFTDQYLDSADDPLADIDLTT